MCKQANKELAKGTLLVSKLVEHVKRMGAGNALIPIKSGEGIWQVIVHSPESIMRRDNEVKTTK